jgi:hypothetical protein
MVVVAVGVHRHASPARFVEGSELLDVATEGVGRG